MCYSLWYNAPTMLPGGGHVYDVFYSESGLELNPEVVTLTPGIPCI